MKGKERGSGNSEWADKRYVGETTRDLNRPGRFCHDMTMTQKIQITGTLVTVDYSTFQKYGLSKSSWDLLTEILAAKIPA